MRTSPVIVGSAAVVLFLTLSPSRSKALTLAPGDLVVVDQVTDVVVRVDPISGAQTLISDAGGGYDVAVAPNGTIWMSQGNNLVQVDPDSGIQTVVASDINLSGGQATGISIAPNGDIIVGTFGGSSSVTRVDPVTGNTTLLSSAGSLNGVAVNSAGDIFIAPELGEQILRLDSSGTLQQTYDLIGPPGQDFGRPEDIAFAPDGDLIVLDGIRDVFLKLDITSGSQTIIDPLVFSSFPFGIAIEAGGDFVFPGFETSSSEAALWRLDPATQIATLITSGDLLPGGNGLRSVAVVPIPEPGTAVLLLLGLTLMARIPLHSRSLS